MPIFGIHFFLVAQCAQHSIMAHFEQLRKEDREEAIRQGIVKNVAQETGFTHSTVSRTLGDKFRRPNPRVVLALKNALAAMGFDLDVARKDAA